ncbi:hypothetical protein BS47DRAFT_1471228 [Hydnum rufescens UP504]|uniref:Uncharacterized protein n=1 Tax=Hydnum rufescens UP504 TaxID=1448309 RepID=A0A9P6ASN4_9AGAM|nr:hypothetical protein BS47DRAFT_1471228 [Hydnum rufescens UP504]
MYIFWQYRFSSRHILERYLYPVAQTLRGGKSIENQGLQFFHIQRVVLHTPGDQVPTFLRDWIHLPTPVPSIPSTSNKRQRSPTPLEAPSKRLKDDSLSVDAMDIDDSSNTKDGSAMDVDDPQSDPLPIPTTSGTSKIVNISDEESNPSSYHSDVDDAPNNAPEPAGPMCDHSHTPDWDLENRFLGLDSHRNVVHVDSRAGPTP